MKIYKDLFLNSLNSLRKDVELYPDDQSLWGMQGDIKTLPEHYAFMSAAT